MFIVVAINLDSDTQGLGIEAYSAVFFFENIICSLLALYSYIEFRVKMSFKIMLGVLRNLLGTNRNTQQKI